MRVYGLLPQGLWVCQFVRKKTQEVMRRCWRRFWRNCARPKKEVITFC